MQNVNLVSYSWSLHCLFCSGIFKLANGLARISCRAGLWLPGYFNHGLTSLVTDTVTDDIPSCVLICYLLNNSNFIIRSYTMLAKTSYKNLAT